MKSRGREPFWERLHARGKSQKLFFCDLTASRFLQARQRNR